MNRRQAVLQAVLEIVRSGGVTAVTFDAVAATAQLSKGGVLYHFPTRDDLLDATFDWILQRWNQKFAEDLSPLRTEDGPTSVVTECPPAIMHSEADLAELAVVVDLLRAPHRREKLRKASRAWPVRAGQPTLDQRIVQLVAAGLWLEESLGTSTTSHDERQQIGARLASLAQVR